MLKEFNLSKKFEFKRENEEGFVGGTVLCWKNDYVHNVLKEFIENLKGLKRMFRSYKEYCEFIDGLAGEDLK